MTRVARRGRGGRGRGAAPRSANDSSVTNVNVSSIGQSTSPVTGTSEMHVEMHALQVRCEVLEGICVDLRTLIEEGRSRMGGLTTHINTQFEIVQHRMQQFVVISADRTSTDNASCSVTTKILSLLDNTDSGLKKVIRTTVRMHMFGFGGEVHASDDRVKNGSECYLLWLSSYMIRYFIAVLVKAQVCNTCPQISSDEWMTTFLTCDRLANEVTRVFDDLRHKFTSNIKAEFLVILLFCLNLY